MGIALGVTLYSQRSDGKLTCPPSPGEFQVIEDWFAGAASIEDLVTSSTMIVVAEYVDEVDRTVSLPPTAERIDLERRYRPVETLKGDAGNPALVSVWLTREFRDQISFALCVKADLPEPAKGQRYVLFLSKFPAEGDGWQWGFSTAPGQARLVNGRLEFEPIVTKRVLPDGRQLSLPPGTFTRFDVSLERVRELAD